MGYQVVIVGLGPAGLMAARTLAKNKINFLAIDNKKKIGLPLKCGEGVREDKFVNFFGDKKYNFVKNKITEHEVIYKGLHRVVVYNVLELDRPKFEQWLAAPIKSRIRLKTRCDDIKTREDCIEVITNKGTIKSDLVILANGCDFKFQKKLGLVKKKQIVILGYGGIYKVNNVKQDRFQYYFNDGFFGYLWLFPKSRNLANIGFGALNTNKSVKETFNKLLRRHNIKAKQLSEYAGLVSCSGPIDKTYDDRLLVCGTAAGFVHAGTGEGIYFALESGKQAAEIAVKALKNKRFDKAFLKSYEKGWRKEFGKGMKGGIIFRDLLFLGLR